MKVEEYFEKKLENADNQHPLKIAYKDNNKYYKDFIKLLKDFNNNLTDKEMIELIDKLQLKSEFNQPKYLQFASEITILYYILRKYNCNFKYEPTYNGKKNPECSFEYRNRIINIEVKCPDLSSKIESDMNNNLKISYQGRVPSKLYNEAKESVTYISNIINLEDSSYSGVEIEKRLDNKLKDYIISASEKFPKDENGYFNILAISLDITKDLDDWYSYIFGYGGVFTDESFVNENYDNVDAILLINTQCGHIRWKEENEKDLWNLEEYINLIFLNPKKVKNNEFYSEYAISIFGDMTKKFLSYLKSLDENNDNLGYGHLEKFIKFIEYNIKEISLISDFLNSLKSKN
ncbi:hypothetical protein ACOT7R_16650 [Clostridium perfringens]|uniref:hypothetical protein n=1 Tax=Clostridium perfringens TaxID=1502 RepID=UPI002900D690|nr:hypothetical protein [Clostridium perfringens]MDU3019936.1 hypothetical protein [Clostridium perfringens]